MATESVTVVKQGWLLKRGEYIKTWRPRWFQLRSDGGFRGFKTGPPSPGDAPINMFDVSGSTLSETDDGKPVGAKGKKYGFMIRFMQLTRFVERSFHLESQEERDEWIQAYEEVKRSANAHPPAPRADASGADAPSHESKDVTIDDFEMLKVLGKGTFGKVMLAKEKKTGELFAIKVLKKEVILEKEEVAHTMTENTVLQSTDHPFLTGLKYSFQTKELLCFVLEYVNGGELFFHLSREKVFTEDRARFYAAEIALAMGYLHDHNIIYRDLKLENLLLDKDGHVKITDFGLCKQEMTFGTTTTTFCGTPEYLAPEILEDNDYGRSVDWWGLGVVMYEMMCGHLPFYNRNHEVLFDLILHEEIRLPDHLSPAAKDILSKMLDKNPHTRLGGGQGDSREITDHAFFASIDFDKLYNKQLPVPFKPKVASETDVSNFDPMFTTEVAQVSPTEQSALQEADAAFANFESGAKS
eukprot:TRINITY_DN11258_c0_g1_i1.p1 TRINITY_DN11258_c0_g1~~TRINITY_DN11258_c0_g1_i1.p1  ORF type:complete len:492 (+),score=136.50 TRINITY_DN11258_c0_g1_i1:71-1477(+)